MQQLTTSKCFRVFTTVMKLVLELDANTEASTKKLHLLILAGCKDHLHIKEQMHQTSLKTPSEKYYQLKT